MTGAFEIFAEGGGNTFGLEVDAEVRLYSGHNGGKTRGWHFVQGGFYLMQGVDPGKFGPLRNPYAFGDLPMMATTDPVVRFTHFGALGSPDLAIDLGTATTRVAGGRGGIRLRPSTSENEQALNHGVIVNAQAATEVLRPMMQNRRRSIKVRLYRAISQESPEEMAEKVASYRAEGYHALSTQSRRCPDTDIALRSWWWNEVRSTDSIIVNKRLATCLAAFALLGNSARPADASPSPVVVVRGDSDSQRGLAVARHAPSRIGRRCDRHSAARKRRRPR